MKTTTKHVRKSYLDSLDWQMMPQDGGKAVDYTYAATMEGVYQRRQDRSCAEVSYRFAPWRQRAAEESMRFEPQHGCVGLDGCCKLRDVIVD